MAKPTRQADSIVSLKVTLGGIRPPIWRRLLVLGRMPLGGLHYVIQAAMGWDDAHLHAFDIAGRQYSDPHDVDGAADEARLTVNGVLRSGVSRFTYTYDFSDGWEHAIVIEGMEAGGHIVLSGTTEELKAGIEKQQSAMNELAKIIDIRNPQ